MIVQKTSEGVRKLALEGGSPVRTAPLPPWPYFAPDEIQAVSAVLAPPI
jgi:hypothetical protein